MLTEMPFALVEMALIEKNPDLAKYNPSAPSASARLTPILPAAPVSKIFKLG
jgi:hypothetical protein